MNLFRIVSGVARKILPKFLAPLATGAVSGLGETAIKKQLAVLINYHQNMLKW